MRVDSAGPIVLIDLAVQLQVPVLKANTEILERPKVHSRESVNKLTRVLVYLGAKPVSVDVEGPPVVWTEQVSRSNVG